MNLHPTSLAALLLTLPLAAQTPNHLVGLTRAAPAFVHIDQHNCQWLQRCVPAAFPGGGNPSPFAGGTAWDPTTGGAWITDGQWLARIDDDCNYQCQPLLLPFPGLNAVATGLEVVESLRQLWLIDSNRFLYQYTLTCPPQQLASCHLSLPAATQVPTGLAADEGLRLLFVGYVDTATNTNWLAVASLAMPCTPLQHLQVHPCPSATFGAMTGLAVDWGNRVLYATDGLAIAALHYQPSAIGGILITQQTCCTPPAPSLDPLVGLAVRPGRETPLGGPCSSPGCPNCPMQFGLGNDPNLGNAEFFLDLQRAPAGAMAWAILGAGPCTPPGIRVPPLCGPIYTPVYLGMLGPAMTTGMTACGGAAHFALPLPVIPSLAGSVISSQAVVLCLTGTVLGNAMSNCTSFELQGS